MAKPLVAIVGRPNVGKSTFFNKMAGSRISIVEDTPGVTRDRVYADCEWQNYKFTLIDTGGIDPDSEDPLLQQMRRQAEIAIETCDVILFFVDGRQGMTADDENVADLIRRAGKPTILVVNKIDNVSQLNDVYDFYQLGMGDPIGVSSVNLLNFGDLLEEVCKFFPDPEEGEEEDEAVKIAVVGKPNVGKSSLLNRILGVERSIVSDMAGTTRDAIDAYYENETGKYLLIDTAGVRRKSRVVERVERYSVLRAFMAVERADVVLILIDARDGVTEQDTKIAGYADDKGKASVIVANKWDITQKDHRTMDLARKEIRQKLGFMDYAPILFISAKTGQRVQKLFPLIRQVNEKNSMRVTTGTLNAMLAEAVARVQPPSDKGRRLRLFYITQSAVRPPTFVTFVNDAELFHFSYRRYLENCIRETFGLDGTPIRMIVRERDEKKGGR